MIIAIDGPAAAGKGTLSSKLAQKYNLSILDTGKLYRAVGVNVLKAGGDPSNPEDAQKAASQLDTNTIISFLGDPELKSNDAGVAASKVSVHPAVRNALLDLQKRFASNPPLIDGKPSNGAILDGRDIGTVVCPNADAKLFITANVETRAERRFLEYQQMGKTIDKQKILKDMIERDERDLKRSVAPLRPAIKSLSEQSLVAP
jgi:cytidylate kinase